MFKHTINRSTNLDVAALHCETGLICRSLYSYTVHYVMFSRIQGTNLEIRVQTPGRLASAQPIPQLIIPARK
jgi:hypothetical protein